MPHDLWCTVFKGEFKLGNDRYCHPLTVKKGGSTPPPCWTTRFCQAAKALLLASSLEADDAIAAAGSLATA